MKTLLKYAIMQFNKEQTRNEIKEYCDGLPDSEIYEVIDILADMEVIEINQSMKLHLFKKLYDSGLFCYTCYGREFIENFDYIQFDLSLISQIVDNKTLSEMAIEFQNIIKDFYYCFGENKVYPIFKEYIC